jgi:hypothetical protein
MIGDDGGEDFSNDTPFWVGGVVAVVVFFGMLCIMIWTVLRWLP